MRMLSCWQIFTTFQICGRTLSQVLNVHNSGDVRQIKVGTADPLIPGPSIRDAEIAIAKLRNCKECHLLGCDAMWLF
jgi:hypothetical protein